MFSARRDRLPRGVVRDLLAIPRMLYRAELVRKPDAMRPARFTRLEEIGKELRLALELSKGARHDGTPRAAWGWAEPATKALGDVVDAHLSVFNVLRAGSEKLRAGS